jgi:hypothetical protein
MTARIDETPPRLPWLGASVRTTLFVLAAASALVAACEAGVAPGGDRIGNPGGEDLGGPSGISPQPEPEPGVLLELRTGRLAITRMANDARALRVQGAAGASTFGPGRIFARDPASDTLLAQSTVSPDGSFELVTPEAQAGFVRFYAEYTGRRNGALSPYYDLGASAADAGLEASRPVRVATLCPKSELPLAIDVGDVRAGARALVPIHLRNACAGRRVVSSVVLQSRTTGTESPFALRSPAVPFAVDSKRAPPGNDEFIIEVEYAPTRDDFDFDALDISLEGEPRSTTFMLRGRVTTD